MTVETVVAAPEELARRWVDGLDREIRARAPERQFTLAVPGGSVAERFLPAIGTLELPPGALALFWVDERAVPPGSPDSNYGAARKILPATALEALELHPIRGAERDPARAAAEYAAELSRAAATPPVLDHVLLGVGEDGHVASVFPGAPLAVARGGSVGWTDRAPKPPSIRVSLTLDTLLAARSITVAAFGAAKAGAVAAALTGASSPCGEVLRRGSRVLLLLDDGAAGSSTIATPREAGA